MIEDASVQGADDMAAGEEGNVAVNPALEASKLLLKSKVNAVMAVIFACVAIVIAMIMVSMKLDGDFTRITDDISVLGYILFPFIPAVYLSLRSASEEKKGKKIFASLEKEES